MHDGCMVFTAEKLSDLRVGGRREVFTEVHGDLPGKSDLLGIAFGFKIDRLEAVEIADLLRNVFQA